MGDGVGRKRINPQLAILRQQLAASPAYVQFMASLPAKDTKISYTDALVHFLRFINNGKNCDELLTSFTPKELQLLVIQFIIHMKDNEGESPNTIRLRTSALKSFFTINDIESINWKKVKKFQGEFYTTIEDRPYSRDEIARLVNAAHTLRDKAIILLLSSSGIRVGGIVKLQIKHLRPIAKYSNYAIDVYKKAKEQYVTFCTPETRKAIEVYLKWREKIGEKLGPESPLFRGKFNVYKIEDVKENVTFITIEAVASFLAKLRQQTDIIEVTPITDSVKRGKPRKETAQAHSFRKYFASTLKGEGVFSEYVEKLMGHGLGLRDVYSKPTPLQLLEGNGDKMLGYAAGINALTINDENRLRDENKSLNDKLLRYVEIQQEIDSIHKELAIIREQKQAAKNYS